MLQGYRARARCIIDSEGIRAPRAEPNGFLVHHLSHSVTLSCLFCQMSDSIAVPIPAMSEVLQPPRAKPSGLGAHRLSHSVMLSCLGPHRHDGWMHAHIWPRPRPHPPCPNGLHPMRAEPSGFGAHRLSHSVMLSCLRPYRHNAWMRAHILPWLQLSRQT